jgi:hypothetical protein
MHFNNPVEIALHLHVSASVAHKTIPDLELMGLPNLMVFQIEPLEIGAQTIEIFRMIAPAHRPVK